ncbi:hypothetical protein DPMN_122722 [Dreissena polymorpha]|uniref:Uncharacterized protein n=1 Tax=Dreissena polymorpha TaxID=45954 RepID=A0A9D4JS94_DREPO|nr:hypothetical protein DPMN_122722 [Dreissena polymorpha]
MYEPSQLPPLVADTPFNIFERFVAECSGHEKMMLVLERVAGSLGFNIMGGLQAFESNNNNNGNTSDLIISNNNNNQHVGMTTEGIIVSKVMVGGPAEKTGLCTHDQIVKFKCYLVMQGASVPSERIFATEGDLVIAHRACLDSDNVDMLIFWKTNIKLYEQ